MKKHTTLFAFILFCLLASAQAPQSMNYQAIARNAAGAVVPNQLVGLRFTIRETTATGTVVYSETQTDTTNQFGLFTTAIGSGTPLTGTFAAIDWSSGDKFLQVEIDAAGGSSYTDMGTSQLLSVPYALYAEKTAPLGQSSTNYYGTANNFLTASDTTYELVPGLAQTITVPAGVTTLLTSSGLAYGPQFNAYATMFVSLFIDGVEVGPQARSTVPIVTDDNISSGGGNWYIMYPVALSPGNHLIEVKTKASIQNQTSITVNGNGLFGLPFLNVTYLRN